jgi:hypothetical protein
VEQHLALPLVLALLRAELAHARQRQQLHLGPMLQNSISAETFSIHSHPQILNEFPSKQYL